MMKAVDIVYAYGHPNIKATHRTTLEITRDEHLTPRGDCIIGIKADKSASMLSNELKKVLRRRDSMLVIILEAEGIRDIALAMGDPKLLFTSDRKIIVRRSRYVEEATIAIQSNKAARDLDRRLIEKLRNPDTVLKVVFIALTLDEVYPVDIGVGGIV